MRTPQCRSSGQRLHEGSHTLASLSFPIPTWMKQTFITYSTNLKTFLGIKIRKWDCFTLKDLDLTQVLLPGKLQFVSELNEIYIDS